MQITINNVETSFTKTAKGGYSTSTISYVNERGENKSWKLISFSNPGVFEKMKNATAGQVYEIETRKNDKDYTEWAKAALIDGATPAAAVPVSKAAAVSQYETRDERNARQRLIVRQSCLSNAVAIVSTGAKSPPDVQAVKDLANELVAFVFEAPDLFEQPSDIPY
jgi:hypothetical protein